MGGEGGIFYEGKRFTIDRTGIKEKDRTFETEESETDSYLPK